MVKVNRYCVEYIKSAEDDSVEAFWTIGENEDQAIEAFYFMCENPIYDIVSVERYVKVNGSLRLYKSHKERSKGRPKPSRRKSRYNDRPYNGWNNSSRPTYFTPMSFFPFF